MKKYFDTLADIQRKGITTVRGSQVETLVNIYTQIGCAIYKQSMNGFKETIQAIDTDINKYTMVVDSPYSNILIADVVIINNIKYQVTNHLLANKRANGQVDNYEFIIARTT